MGAAVLGTGLGATVASGAISGSVAGQAGRATENAINREEITAGPGDPRQIALDATLGGAGAAVGYGLGKLVKSAVLSGEKPAQVTLNKMRGAEFRDTVADTFEQNGFSTRTEVYKPTPFGKRYIDIEVTNPTNGRRSP